MNIEVFGETFKIEIYHGQIVHIFDNQNYNHDIYLIMKPIGFMIK